MTKVAILSKVLSEKKLSSVRIPLFSERVAAGFPSPADDYLEGPLDLNKHLIRHPAATFFVRVTGDSMIGAGIHSGDMLIVDRALEPADHKVVIAAVNGELTVKRLCRQNDRLVLMPENDEHKPILIENETDCEIWGVVTNVIHPL
ncbi:MAG: translesion error-prone DNA polymerase V autoproteolytic subunit [bacterium]